MDSSARKSHKVYQSHRENQRERILEAAETLFIQHGIDNVNIGQIARAARISRMTLYEYFPNKQEVAWAIFQKIVDDQKAQSDGQLVAPGSSGFERLERWMLGYVEALNAHQDYLRFIVEFNTLYAREGNPARVRQIVEQSSGRGGYSLVTEVMRQGIADGSIRPGIDPALLSSAFMNLLNAVNSRFALLGDLISEEYGQPVTDIYLVICRAFLRGIQNPPPPQESIDEKAEL